MNIPYTLIIYPITLLIEFIFVFAQNFFKETGLAIVCMSLAISVLCLPLYLVAEKWQEIERKIQKEMAAKIVKIKASFRGDERYMILSTYYRQNKYHPIFAMRSTFGLLVQIPFFIAAYGYLSHLEAIKGASFFFIRDLGQPDKLIPLSGGINLLPILMTLINCAAGAIYTHKLAIKEKIPVYGMSIIFLILLYKSPSALVLYWTLNNIFSLAKNCYLKLDFNHKQYILSGTITSISLFVSYYSLFIFHGNYGFRILVSISFVMVGLLPWFIPAISRLIKKISNISWLAKENVTLFLVSAFILWIASGLFLPSTLIGASSQEFSNIDSFSSPLVFIYITAIQALGIFVLWPLAIYFLVSKNTRTMLGILATIISFSALFNIFVFSGNYSYISNFLVFDRTPSHNYREILINFSLLLGLSLIILLSYFKKLKRILHFSSIILLVALLSISIKNIYSINNEYQKLSEYHSPEHSSDEVISPIIQLSRTGKNVLVIMLDMAASVFLPYIFEENPDLYQKYSGFTYYPNTVSFNGYTKGGAPPIFGGYEYTPIEINKRANTSLNTKFNESLLLMPKLFSESGFSVTVTDPPYADGHWIPDLRIYEALDNVNSYITDGVYTNRWLNYNNIELPSHSDVLERNILWYSFFRSLPLAFRQAVYFSGSWCASFSEARMRNFLNGYSVLDFLNKLTAFVPPQNNTALFMTINTAHESMFLQAPLYKPQLSISGYYSGNFGKEIKYHANAAAIIRLSEYFDFLKLNGVYDNTRIILVSDHGVLENTFVTKTNLPFHVDHYNSLLMVKDFNSQDNLKIDTSFMSTADVPALAMQGLIENPFNPFTMNPITENPKKEPLLILVNRVNEINNNEIELGIHNTYYVINNIFDEKNWTKPDKLP